MQPEKLKAHFISFVISHSLIIKKLQSLYYIENRLIDDQIIPKKTPKHPRPHPPKKTINKTKQKNPNSVKQTITNSV